MYGAICLCGFGPERCLCQQKDPAVVGAAIFWAVCRWVTVCRTCKPHLQPSGCISIQSKPPSGKKTCGSLPASFSPVGLINKVNALNAPSSYTYELDCSQCLWISLTSRRREIELSQLPTGMSCPKRTVLHRWHVLALPSGPLHSPGFKCGVFAPHRNLTPSARSSWHLCFFAFQKYIYPTPMSCEGS